MLFTEPLFLFLFLPILLGLYFISPKRARNFILLCASLIFYAFGETFYLSILLLSILINYVSGLAIDRAREPRGRSIILWLGITGNLLLLGTFKYAVFLVANLNHLLAFSGRAPLPLPQMHLPIGISFFTFMGMSYLIDVYWRQIKVERRLDIFALYVTLFPHLVAGPIVRFSEIARELVERRTSRAEFAEGVRRFVVGLGKKMLIANTLALTVDSIYSAPSNQLTTAAAWLGTFCYALQIYFDFSGYTDMAIGLARIFGFHFPENFNYPYTAQSISEFWRRWHITLSSWFRDYLFFPLSFRRPHWRVMLNLFFVFLLCGLWHGARWNFIVWGMIHGSFLVFEGVGLAKWLTKLPRLARHLYVMLVIVFGSVFFRSETLSQALGILKVMFGAAGSESITQSAATYMNAELLLAIAAAIIGCLPVAPWLRSWQEKLAAELRGATSLLMRACLMLTEMSAMILIFVASAALSAAGTYAPFIYFKF